MGKYEDSIYEELPNPLTIEETNDLLLEIANGNESAKNKLVEHNIKLVIYRINNNFKNVEYEKKELISIGVIGLIKAINGFDLNKKNKFSSYATKCIDNEILMFLRARKRDIKTDSLETPVKDEGNEITLKDVLTDGNDIKDEYEDKEVKKIIRKDIELLSEPEREMIKLYFGFYDGKPITQREIAKIFNYDVSSASKIIKKSIKKLGNILVSQGVIELKEPKSIKRVRKQK